VEGDSHQKIDGVLTFSSELAECGSLLKGQIQLYDIDSDDDTLESDALGEGPLPPLAVRRG